LWYCRLFKGQEEDELKQIFEGAFSQGLRNTLGLGLRSVYLLFGVKVELEQITEEKMLRSTSDADLMMTILYPRASAIRWPRRSKMLWDLCDDKSAFPAAIFWKIGGDICRQLYQDRGRSPVLSHHSWSLCLVGLGDKWRKLFVGRIPSGAQLKGLLIRIAMIGGGYVGLVSGACFAEFGSEVAVVERNSAKLKSLHSGDCRSSSRGLRTWWPRT
jgi:hypothetical protein